MKITKEEWDKMSIEAKYKALVTRFPTIAHEIIPSSKKIVEQQLDLYFEDYLLPLQ